MNNSSNQLNRSGSLNKRCNQCNKKKHILIRCPCNREFCLECRFPDTHSCVFNFRAKSEESLMKNNQKVISEKVHNKL
jgi:predicted nucleic acid binding AN1-type Zn finger protein